MCKFLYLLVLQRYLLLLVLATDKTGSQGWRGLSTPKNTYSRYTASSEQSSSYVPTTQPTNLGQYPQMAHTFNLAQFSQQPPVPQGYMLLNLPQASQFNIQSLFGNQGHSSFGNQGQNFGGLSSFTFPNYGGHGLFTPNFYTNYPAQTNGYAVQESNENDASPSTSEDKFEPPKSTEETKKGKILETIPSFKDWGQKYPQFNFQDLGETTSFQQPSTKLVKITNTVGVKVPFAYPVKIPYHIPVPIPVHKPYQVSVPHIVKVPEPVPVPVSNHQQEPDYSQHNYQQESLQSHPVSYEPQHNYFNDQNINGQSSKQYEYIPQYEEHTPQASDTYATLAQFKASIEHGLQMATSQDFEKSQPYEPTKLSH